MSTRHACAWVVAGLLAGCGGDPLQPAPALMVTAAVRAEAGPPAAAGAAASAAPAMLTTTARQTAFKAPVSMTAKPPYGAAASTVPAWEVQAARDLLPAPASVSTPTIVRPADSASDPFDRP
jgi:hypothetical protein